MMQRFAIVLLATVLGLGGSAALLDKAGLAASGILPGAALPTPPPLPPKKPVTETFFGTSVTDPYRYFENMNDPVVQAFFKNQNAYARATLARLEPGRTTLLDRIKTLDNAGASVSGVVRDGGFYFYERLDPGQNSVRLFVRPVAGGPERLLVDPDALVTKPGQHFTINYFAPSFDGKYVAYGISEGGSENAIAHVVDATSGQLLADAIDRAEFGITSWRTDNHSFYYVRLQKLAPNAAETEKFQKSICYLHVLGDDPTRMRRSSGTG